MFVDGGDRSARSRRILDAARSAPKSRKVDEVGETDMEEGSDAEEEILSSSSEDESDVPTSSKQAGNGLVQVRGSSWSEEMENEDLERSRPGKVHKDGVEIKVT